MRSKILHNSCNPVFHCQVKLIYKCSWTAVLRFQDMTPDLLPTTFIHIYQGLSDPVDDVVAVAASALVPVSECVIQVLPSDVPGVVNCLWDSLLELDDLCASTNSIMALLTSILSHPTQISVQ